MNILSKSWWKTALQQKAATIPTPGTLHFVNGTIINSPDNKQSYLNNGYNINDLIYSIVNLISEKVKVAPWAVYKVEDDDALKAYHAILRKKEFTTDDYLKAKSYRKKALVVYEGDEKLNELIKWPNETQTFSDLVADSSVYKLLTGDRFIWAELLNAGANQGKPQSLHLLPSDQIAIAVNNQWPLTITSYKITAWGLQDIPKVNVLHDKYFNPNCDSNGTHLLGLAPLKAALALTTRSNAENTAATMSYQNGGPKGIVFMDDARFTEAQGLAQSQAVKRILTSKEYVGSENNNKIAVSGYKMNYVPIGLSPADLEIIESEKWSLRRFCNVFGGVPSQLLNDPDNKVYNNTVEGEKALTSRCALPQLNSFRDHFNKKLGTDWGYKDKKIYVDYDISVFTELQEDLGKKWTYLKDLPLPNKDKLEAMGYEIPEGHDEFMDKILVSSGYELSDTYGESETDRALADGDEEVPEDER